MNGVGAASVLVVHPADNAGVAELVASAGVQRKLHSDDHPPGALDTLLQTPPAVVATVIDTSVAQPLPLARRIQQAAPLAQMIFVADENVRRRYRMVPLVGAHWVVVDRNNPQVTQEIRDHIALGEQRLRHRTALNRANLRLQSRANVDPQTLHRLVLSDHHLTSLIKHSPDPIVTVALDGEVMGWNRSAEELWGWRASETLGRKLKDFFAPETRDVLSRSMEVVARTREHVRQELVATPVRGDPVAVELTLAPVLDEHGEALAFAVIVRDISERKRADRAAAEYRQTLERAVAERTAELQHTVEQLEQFSYTVSHDLRGPLRAMQGYAQILEEELTGADTAQAAHYASRIVRSAERMDRLIADVLSYSRISTVTLERSAVDTNSLVHEIISHLPEQTTRGAEITVEPLPGVIAHEALLAQALANLIGNAVKFVPADRRPRVRIWSEPRGEHVRVLISDNGIGVPDDFRRKIFGLFERGVHAGDYEGTGIGLAIVKKSIERLGGTVGFDSRPGEGAVFWIELPAVPPVARPPLA